MKRLVFFQAGFPAARVALAVHDRNNGNKIREGTVDDQVRKTAGQGHTGTAVDNRKKGGVAGNKSEAGVHASHKLSPQAKATPFIP